jgi:hypothetical protein
LPSEIGAAGAKSGFGPGSVTLGSDGQGGRPVIVRWLRLSLAVVLLLARLERNAMKVSTERSA